MTIAAKQCREYIVRQFPGTPISRYSCRDTAGGDISQHSARGVTESDPTGYDSNALDIYGPSKGRGPGDQAWIQTIVDDLLGDDNGARWSIRKIIWKDGGRHENHAHVDFSPMITVHMWCNRDIVPYWEYWLGTPGGVTTRDPEPENGRYGGEPTMDVYPEYVFGLVSGWAEDPAKTRTEFNRLKTEGKLGGSVDYWVDLLADPGSPEWLGFVSRTSLSSW